MAPYNSPQKGSGFHREYAGRGMSSHRSRQLQSSLYQDRYRLIFPWLNLSLRQTYYTAYPTTVMLIGFWMLLSPLQSKVPLLATHSHEQSPPGSYSPQHQGRIGSQLLHVWS